MICLYYAGIVTQSFGFSMSGMRSFARAATRRYNARSVEVEPGSKEKPTDRIFRMKQRNSSQLH
jgi:hypothetical protein